MLDAIQLVLECAKRFTKLLFCLHWEWKPHRANEHERIVVLRGVCASLGLKLFKPSIVVFDELCCLLPQR